MLRRASQLHAPSRPADCPSPAYRRTRLRRLPEQCPLHAVGISGVVFEIGCQIPPLDPKARMGTQILGKHEFLSRHDLGEAAASRPRPAKPSACAAPRANHRCRRQNRLDEPQRSLANILTRYAGGIRPRRMIGMIDAMKRPARAQDQHHLQRKNVKRQPPAERLHIDNGHQTPRQDKPERNCEQRGEQRHRSRSSSAQSRTGAAASCRPPTPARVAAIANSRA